MADTFTPITTQEDFDAAISKRLDRERRTIREQYGDYDDLKKKVGDYETQIGNLTKSNEDLQRTIKGHETNSAKMRIAYECGIPFAMASRLSGETEDEIRADAQALSKFVSPQTPAPLGSTEPAAGDPQKAALKKMLQTMKGE